MLELFKSFNFKQLSREDFKEDSVRELIITPLLNALGFNHKDKTNGVKLSIKRSLRVTTPTKIGSNKSIKANEIIIPDYVLYHNNKPICVLDAKAPKEEIFTGEHPQQVFYYAINPEIKSFYYALCNGYSFVLFTTMGQKELLRIDLKHITEKVFIELELLLKNPTQAPQINLFSEKHKEGEEWYRSRKLPNVIDKPQKQAKFRYFGCLAYFTRQSWDIVAENIQSFTQRGDVVLDPFGGSGVTAIEATMLGRFGVHTDLNPLSVFMTKAICAKINLAEMQSLSEEIVEEFEKICPKNDKDVRELFKKAKYYSSAIGEEFGKVSTREELKVLWIPKDELLPKGSDVPTLLDLFTKRQLVELALLKRLILLKTLPSGDRENRKHKESLRYSLLLAFRNTVDIINLTFHNTPKGGGASGVYLYYRHRIAPDPANRDIMQTFKRKVQRILKGKLELEQSSIFYSAYFYPAERVIKNFKSSLLEQREEDLNHIGDKEGINGERFFQADATNLSEIKSNSIDYIYTDPPYGAKIPYLDLSILWNAWLDFSVDSALREKECIEKGSLEKSREEYIALMKQSLEEMYRVLKFNRWFTLVFQHQDLQLWQILVECAEAVGFEYAGSVLQSNGQTSFKKRQNPLTVLSGQLIIYFRKVDSPKARIKNEIGGTMEIIEEDIQNIIIKKNGATLEEIFAKLQMLGLEGGYTHRLAEHCDNITGFINQNFDLDAKSQKYHIPINAKVSANVPLEDRARYFTIAVIKENERLKEENTIDNICFKVLPRLKNGVIPDESLIRDILNEIAIMDKYTNQWKLKTKDRRLFEEGE